MDTKLGAPGTLQQPNVTSSAQQPSRATNALQQPTGQVGALQQPTQLGSLQSSQLGSYQPSSQLGSNFQPSSQLGSYQQPSQPGSLQQPTQLGSYQQPSQLGSLQQPTQLGSYQQPSQLGSQQQPTQLGSYQQPSQLGSLQQPTQLGSYQQPSSQLGSLQQPNQQLVPYQQPISQQLGALQMGSFQQPGKVAPFSMQQLLRSDRGNMLTLSDDNWMVKQIQATHAPDGRVVDPRPVLYLVEDILKRATLNPSALITTGTEAQLESFEEKTHQTGFVAMLDALSFTIDRISCEISYKALSGTDAHQTTLSIFQQLSLFDWDAKLVLTLAAFALQYGEFWLLAQIYSTNQLAKAMALLRQVPGLIERASALKPRFDALNNLIDAILEVTRCIVQFKELPSGYIAPEASALSTAIALIPTAVYWSIRSIVACATQITSFNSMGYEFAMSTTEAHWELSTLAHKLKNMRDHLKEQLEKCYLYIEGKKDDEYFQMLVNLFNMIHMDNLRVLRALINPRDDPQPLVDGSTKKKVSIEVLRRKNVLLLISGLNISQDELSILEQIYNESRLHPTRLESQYELVWIPVVDSSTTGIDSIEKQFQNMQSTMPWYTVHPSLIGRPVVRFIKEKWHLRKKPILVVLDPQGKVVSPNAIHMMWIWVSNAFPFTSSKEEALWREETWRLELLVDGIDQTILNWIKDGKYIFMYGGDDIEWIRKFTSSARSVASAERIPLEMFYVGKSSKREQVKRVIKIITLEKLSSCWQDPAMVWFFWTRLESMLFSKIQLDKADDHQDPVMQGIKRLLSYDKEGGWAVLSKGSSIVVNGHGDTVFTTLAEYETWKVNVPLLGFDVAFKNHHDLRHGEKYPCCRFEFSRNAGRIPASMKCPQCHHNMEEYTTFLCCHEEDVPAILYD